MQLRSECTRPKTGRVSGQPVMHIKCLTYEVRAKVCTQPATAALAEVRTEPLLTLIRSDGVGTAEVVAHIACDVSDIRNAETWELTPHGATIVKQERRDRVTLTLGYDHTVEFATASLNGIGPFFDLEVTDRANRVGWNLVLAI